MLRTATRLRPFLLMTRLLWHLLLSPLRVCDAGSGTVSYHWPIKKEPNLQAFAITQYLLDTIKWILVTSLCCSSSSNIVAECDCDQQHSDPRWFEQPCCDRDRTRVFTYHTGFCDAVTFEASCSLQYPSNSGKRITAPLLHRPSWDAMSPDPRPV